MPRKVGILALAMLLVLFTQVVLVLGVQYLVG